MPAGVTTNIEGKPKVPYQSWHTIQPSFFPYENYPKKADGSSFDCRGAIFYSYGYMGTFPETYVGIHY